LQIESTSLNDTLEAAAAIGHCLRGGEVIELLGDLGSGKTTFVKGLAQGMGSQDMVHSPSFTLSNEYKAGELTLYHFDFHRLSEPGIIRDELAEILSDDKAVVAVEWADIIEDVLPTGRLSVTIKPYSEEGRRLDFSYPEKLNYLFPNNT
jgi:tRNA threonylcarbamoyladenosine biosynthesis protein TsaE